MTISKDRTIKLDDTTRMRVLDMGDKQIRIRIETPTPSPKGRSVRPEQSPVEGPEDGSR